jgi:hypothetical protein
MKETLIKIAIAGIPLLLSLLWFFYWVVRLHKAKKRPRPKRTAETGLEDPR